LTAGYYTIIIIKGRKPTMRILIAEDEVATAKALKLLLEKAKYSVDIVHTGTDAWDYISGGVYEVVVLDIMMPGMSGIDVLINMRKNQIKTPVLMLTAKAELEDRVAGLEAGADDYLPKPFATSELIARVKALGRRSENYNDTVQETGNLILDGNRYEMRVGDKSVTLTNKEYQLMELFVTHPGFVFSTDHLMEKIWGLDTDSEVDVVWTTIGYVRKKLRSIDADVEIKTIRGAGYSLEVITC
jgi:DNA-binding response OmpR family regulator